jgi:hypothetical protein
MSAGKEAAMIRLYDLKECTCPHCGNTGPFELDSDDAFTCCEDGTLRFAEDTWGFDILCGCPECGFYDELTYYVEWVSTTIVHGPMPTRDDA